MLRETKQQKKQGYTYTNQTFPKKKSQPSTFPVFEYFLQGKNIYNNKFIEQLLMTCGEWLDDFLIMGEKLLDSWTSWWFQPSLKKH